MIRLTRFFRGESGIEITVRLWLEIDKYSGNDLKNFY